MSGVREDGHVLANKNAGLLDFDVELFFCSSASRINLHVFVS